MADLELARSIGKKDQHVVVTTLRPGGGIQASIVSGGVLDHPLSGQPVVGIVVRGRTVKLKHLRRDPRMTVVFRSGGEWVAVEGRAELAGPDDELPGFDRSRVPRLLRDIFSAAGGTHDNWPEYDRVMAEERRCGVLIQPERVYSNAGRG